ncbi:MAG TPA: DUF192 domain-containing protein [Devosia sp.]|nr:DUF192 domain-containing protein [Devosia sp.]
MPRPRTNSLNSRRFWIVAAAVAIVAIGVAIIVGPRLLAGDSRLVLHTAKGDFSFAVEIADTDETRARGLMFRQSLAPDAGMLFDYHREQVANFWMQNTFIPLDMVFVGADGLVKTVHVNARPMDTTTISSEVPVRFVLEIPGGRAVEIGLAPGDRMEHARVGAP